MGLKMQAKDLSFKFGSIPTSHTDTTEHRNKTFLFAIEHIR